MRKEAIATKTQGVDVEIDISDLSGWKRRSEQIRDRNPEGFKKEEIPALQLEYGIIIRCR